MRFGLSEEDWFLLTNLLIDPLKSAGAEVWIFGSRARGDHFEFSDVDVAYASSHVLPPGMISCIRENLEESRLPYKVDLGQVTDIVDSYRAGILRDRIAL